MTRVDAEAVVEHLVDLARRELSGDAPRSTVRSLPDLRRPAAAPLWQRWAWPGAALGAAALVLWLAGAWLFAPETPITYQVEGGAVVAGKVVGSGGTRLRFSEGSEMVLARGAQAQVSKLDHRGGTVRVRGGRTRVTIAHRSEAAWAFQAGPNVVRVTGTEFDLAWNEAESTLDVALVSGSVEVTGDALGGPVRLRAGQRLVRHGLQAPAVMPLGDSPDSALTSEPEAATPGPLAPAETPAAPEVAIPGQASAGVTDGKSRGADSSWSRLVARGDFARVLAEAERQGLDAVLARAPLPELRALADAARYARRTTLAERALTAQRQRFGSSHAARDAAFLLGQLAESQGRGALAWYDTYLREAPAGTYAPQALGRKMMIAYGEGGGQRAEAIANDYLVRYPQGPYAAAARRIVSEASSTRR